MKVLVTRTQINMEGAIPDLEREFPGVEFVYCADRAQAADLIGDADVYFGGMNRELFLAARNLKWIQSSSTGINPYLDIPELVEGDVLLTGARGTHSVCLAESVLAMILAQTRGIVDCMRLRAERNWSGRAIRSTLQELTGSTMGIVGFGSVGRALAKRAQAFDVRILAVDAYPGDKPEYVAELSALDGLDDLLRESDYVVVTVPYTPQTDNMIGAKQFALMKPSAMLVLISRGGIVDQVALAQALREGQIARAAIDVAVPEPLPPDHELWDLDNLLITFHVAGGTQYEDKYMLDIFRENLKRFLKGDLPLRNQVDKTGKGF
jgi:phosphoglycerate dehydrogenase-like enzyme